MILRVALAASLLLAAASAAVAPLPARAESPSPVIISMNLNPDLNVDFETTRPQTRTATFLWTPTLTAGIYVQWESSAHSSYSLRIGATPQAPLHRGIFTAMETALKGSEPHDLDASLDSYGFQTGGLSQIDVLDIAADASGTLTRFDILYQQSRLTAVDGAFGEIRMNEPESTSSVSLSARELEWPRVGFGDPVAQATTSVHNTSKAPLSLGTASIHGGAVHDYSIRGDTCSGRRLPPAADCAITVAYAPTKGGPRVSTLDVPVGREVVPVSLSGSAPLGTTTLTSSGKEAVDLGSTHAFSGLLAYAFGSTRDRPVAHTYRWVPDPVSPQRKKDFFADARLDLTSLSGPLTTGKHVTGDYTTSPHNLVYSAYYRSCSSLTGSETVNALKLGADGQPTYASVDFTQSCVYSGSAGTMTGHLRYQARGDLTAPAKPTQLAVSGHRVTWKTSTSHDLATTIVRAQPGTRANPISGYAVSVGSATSARLPVLRRGQKYTVAAFSVDQTGNVSSPAVTTFTY